MRRDPLPDPTAASAPSSALAPAWPRAALLASAIAMLVLVAAYWSTAAGMAEIWARSDTFAHGYVVPIVSAWLAWRHRSLLRGATARPALWALAAVALAGFGWLLGELAEVNALRQFALVALLILTVPVIAGIDVARRLAFPLAFLLFAVPFGEFLLPQLMEWTASFTILALKASGIPVYREGLHFVIPSGSWSVVEACSGVRYLIASVMVGTLFAYLTYQSLWRRIVFVAISFVVPVLANWLRAYMIVMLGHLSGNRLAVGVDHLIYGWVFFGVVMLLMFWIGAKWREDEPKPAVAAPRAAAGAGAVRGTSTAALGIAATAFLAFALAPVVASRALEGDVAAPAPRLAPLGEIAGWARAAEPLTSWRPRYLQPPAERFETFTGDGRAVGLYVAYYRNQSAARKLVSSDNVLVASNDRQWLQPASGQRASGLASGPETVRTADLTHRGGDRLRVWQWYWVDGQWTDSPVRAKALTAWSQLSGRGDDSAVVMVVTPQGSGPGAAAAADAVLASFAGKSTSAIAAMLQTTREGR
jgi:exosortase A